MVDETEYNDISLEEVRVRVMASVRVRGRVSRLGLG